MGRPRTTRLYSRWAVRNEVLSNAAATASTGHGIIVTRPGTDMMTAYRKAPDRPKPCSHPKLAGAYRELARNKRISRPRLSGRCDQGAGARVDCVGVGFGGAFFQTLQERRAGVA